MDPSTNIQYLKGVGPARAKLYERLGIRTLRDLLYHFPRSYIDLSAPVPAGECRPGDTCAVRAEIIRKHPEARIRRGLSLFKCEAADDSGELTITFFNAKYAFEKLQTGSVYLFYGSVTDDGRLGRTAMASPLVFDLAGASALMPVYPLTAGLTNKIVSDNARQALAAVGESLPDPLPDELRARYSLCALPYALQSIHFPDDARAAQLARERFIFEELFTLTLALRSIRSSGHAVRGIPIVPFEAEEFYAALPFEPTGAQRRAAAEILDGMGGGAPMNRLLQGDVGSGKTLVAAAACLAAARSGCQSAVMAPTEILAEQHQQTFEAFLAPFGVRVALLTGSMGVKARREALARIASGECAVAVGTHALLSGGVEFARLALVVTDEQHRFGVSQRVTFQGKGDNPHVLVMSATPIPRTLALIIYGDLDLSVLDELPKGRIPINTYCVSSGKLKRAWGFVRAQLDEGRQAYVVCPLVSDEEAGLPGLKAAEQIAAELAEGELRDYRIGLLHGKLKAAQKEQVMRDFKAGALQLLVCTTVVEVGVDVPNATVLVCLNAERFGLSQLHQLRGRVGRGKHASHCILVSDARGATARERLGAMCQTGDGFKIAEYDLKLRGPGDFFGEKQHGLPEMRVADMAQDMGALGAAQEAALALLAADPELRDPAHAALAELCARIVASVGGRPN